MVHGILIYYLDYLLELFYIITYCFIIYCFITHYIAEVCGAVVYYFSSRAAEGTSEVGGMVIYCFSFRTAQGAVEVGGLVDFFCTEVGLGTGEEKDGASWDEYIRLERPVSMRRIIGSGSVDVAHSRGPNGDSFKRAVSALESGTFNDAVGVNELVAEENTCGNIFEPIQGGGVRRNSEFLIALKKTWEVKTLRSWLSRRSLGVGAPVPPQRDPPGCHNQNTSATEFPLVPPWFAQSFNDRPTARQYNDIKISPGYHRLDHASP
ncbi:acetylornithine aminotransferase [Rhizina undulata]